MMVIDASAMIEALVGRRAEDELLDALQGDVHAPHLLDVEVLSVLRGLTLSGKLKSAAAEQACIDYLALTVARYEVQPLAERMWELRHNYTTYDAYYLALAEALAVPLYTCDQKLDGEGHRAQIKVVARSH